MGRSGVSSRLPGIVIGQRGGKVGDELVGRAGQLGNPRYPSGQVALLAPRRSRVVDDRVGERRGDHTVGGIGARPDFLDKGKASDGPIAAGAGTGHHHFMGLVAETLADPFQEGEKVVKPTLMDGDVIGGGRPPSTRPRRQTTVRPSTP